MEHPNSPLRSLETPRHHQLKVESSMLQRHSSDHQTIKSHVSPPPRQILHERPGFDLLNPEYWTRIQLCISSSHHCAHRQGQKYWMSLFSHQKHSFRSWYKEAASKNPKSVVVMIDTTVEQENLKVMENAVNTVLNTLGPHNKASSPLISIFSDFCFNWAKVSLSTVIFWCLFCLTIQVGVVCFGSTAETADKNTESGANCYKDKLVQAVPENINYLKREFVGKTISTGTGGSNFIPAFEMAFRFFKPRPAGHDTGDHANWFLFLLVTYAPPVTLNILHFLLAKSVPHDSICHQGGVQCSWPPHDPGDFCKSKGPNSLFLM